MDPVSIAYSKLIAVFEEKFVEFDHLMDSVLVLFYSTVVQL